jgi:hypothetical protein
MSEIKFIPLIDLLKKYPQQIYLIKDKYCKLLSELTFISYIETPLFTYNVF